MLHSQLLPSDNHPFYKWTYASDLARQADASFTSADCGKIAWETSSNSFWILTSITPITWVALGTSTAAASSTNIAGALVARDVSGNFAAGRITATLEGSVVGNADTASALATARTFTVVGTVSGTTTFDGSGNVTIVTSTTPGAIVLGTDTTGAYVANITATGTGLTVANTGADFVISSNATANNLPSTIVARDTSGDFTARNITAAQFIGPITGSISGNASTATKWAAPISIYASGSNTGNTQLDGSASVTLNLTPAPNAIVLGPHTSGNYIATATVSGNGLTAAVATGESSILVVTSNATATSTPSTAVFRDASGNFAANVITAAQFIGPITGSISGSAASADKLTTARTIALTGGVVGSASFDGSANISIATNINIPTITLGTNTAGNYVDSVIPGTGVNIVGGVGAGTIATISIGQDISPTAIPAFAGLALTGNSTTTGNITSTKIITARDLVADTLHLSAGTVTGAPLRITPGVGPTAPVDGDIWSTAAGIYSRINGTTEVLAAASQLTGYVSKAGDSMTGSLTINGALSATTKNFLIPHPTKPDTMLRYGSLEGPENGVYIRGKTTTSVIELPEYWTKLVDPASITVSLTAVGSPQDLIVAGIWENKVFIINSADAGAINCFYHIFAERCDVEKLQTEALNRRA